MGWRGPMTRRQYLAWSEHLDPTPKPLTVEQETAYAKAGWMKALGMEPVRAGEENPRDDISIDSGSPKSPGSTLERPVKQ